ncbi:hypothetical protein [Roseomonas populi]|uniref:Uncharacterized protein n=1 Tax=Roseomonas populi TaxID=3121582 RepID=A0ABT1X2W2_9PROT|nr:hypothetical protein [Roseomonas pecuniae]MCR0982455.1 hypothetical protein [Roseomonas pecuniae]
MEHETTLVHPGVPPPRAAAMAATAVPGPLAGRPPPGAAVPQAAVRRLRMALEAAAQRIATSGPLADSDAAGAEDGRPASSPG